MEFAKALDKVPHRRFLTKLEAYGVNSLLLNRIKVFLKNRRRIVVLGKIVSSWVEILSDVPQRSMLGLLQSKLEFKITNL